MTVQCMIMLEVNKLDFAYVEYFHSFQLNIKFCIFCLHNYPVFSTIIKQLPPCISTAQIG